MNEKTESFSEFFLKSQDSILSKSSFVCSDYSTTDSRRNSESSTIKYSPYSSPEISHSFKDNNNILEEDSWPRFLSERLSDIHSHDSLLSCYTDETTIHAPPPQLRTIPEHLSNDNYSNQTSFISSCKDGNSQIKELRNYNTTISGTHPIFYGVIDSQFEQLCRQIVPTINSTMPLPSLQSTGDISTNFGQSNGNSVGGTKKRNRVIFCRVCNQFKPRSTRARFQSCDHIACYDCVRVALHVEFWAVKTNLTHITPRAMCPVCRTPLDWSSIKPYIVLSEEAKYSPVLTLAFVGRDIPPNTPCYYRNNKTQSYLGDECITLKRKKHNDIEARKRFDRAKKVVEAFFPQGVDNELLMSHIDFSQSTPRSCAELLLGLVPLEFSCVYLDPLGDWRKSVLKT